MVDFRFMYEHKAREMESIVLLMYELSKRGYSFDYYPCNGMGGVPKDNARVVITPYLYKDAHLEALRQYAAGTCTIVNMQWEQVYATQYDGNPDFIHYPHGYAKKVVHLCWGDIEFNSLIKCGIEKHNLFLTGPIHIDFLRPEFVDFHYSKEEIGRMYHIDYKQEWILFISSFSGDAVKVDNTGKVIDENDRDRSKTIILSWIVDILVRRPDIVVIYKMHPNEKTDPRIQEMEKTFLNFKLVDSLSVTQWIRVSDNVITWISTSTPEAFFAKKNCIIARPLEIARDEDIVILADAKKATSLEEIYDQLDGGYDFPVDREIIDKYYNVTEIPSYMRICDVLEKVLYNSSFATDFKVSIEKPFSLSMKQKFASSPFYYYYINIMGNFDISSSKYIPYSLKCLVENSKMRKRDYIKKEEVENLFSIFKRIRI